MKRKFPSLTCDMDLKNINPTSVEDSMGSNFIPTHPFVPISHDIDDPMQFTDNEEISNSNLNCNLEQDKDEIDEWEGRKVNVGDVGVKGNQRINRLYINKELQPSEQDVHCNQGQEQFLRHAIRQKRKFESLSLESAGPTGHGIMKEYIISPLQTMNNRDTHPKQSRIMHEDKFTSSSLHTIPQRSKINVPDNEWRNTISMETIRTSLLTDTMEGYSQNNSPMDLTTNESTNHSQGSDSISLLESKVNTECNAQQEASQSSVQLSREKHDYHTVYASSNNTLPSLFHDSTSTYTDLKDNTDSIIEESWLTKLNITLPTHKTPHIYKSSSFLARYVLHWLRKLPMEKLEQYHILELGAGYSALPSIVCLHEYIRRLSQENNVVYKNHDYLNSDRKKFHLWITDGADSATYNDMQSYWIKNILFEDACQFLSSKVDSSRKDSELHIASKDPFMKVESKSFNDSYSESIFEQLATYCTFNCLEWQNFYKCPRSVDLILASDTIHNRNKKSWDDFFSCASYCLRRTLFQYRNTIHSGMDKYAAPLGSPLYENMNSESDEYISRKRLWLMIQMRDENENIEFYLRKWKLEAHLLGSEDENGLLLFEIQSLV